MASYVKTAYVKKPVATSTSTASKPSTPSTAAKPAASTILAPPTEPNDSPAPATSTSTSISNSSTSGVSSSVKPPTAIGINTSGALDFQDGPPAAANHTSLDWSQSYHGLGLQAFPPEAGAILTSPLQADDIEIKPDGLIYLPEIKYRRILNKAFGPGGWGLAPRSETIITPKMVTREYALICQGRLVAVARGEQDYFDPSGIPTATEGCKSNAMMRCCKDLGVASELWDPRFIRTFKKKYAQQIFVEHVTTKKKKSIWIRTDDEVTYPFKKC